MKPKSIPLKGKILGPLPNIYRFCLWIKNWIVWIDCSDRNVVMKRSYFVSCFCLESSTHDIIGYIVDKIHIRRMIYISPTRIIFDHTAFNPRRSATCRINASSMKVTRVATTNICTIPCFKFVCN